MTARRDPDRLIRDFLAEGQTELADPIYDVVRAEIDRKRQRVVIGPWRFPPMNKLVPIAVGGAAVVAALVVGAQFLRPTGPSGPGAAPSSPPATVSPSPSVSSSPQPTFALTTSDFPVKDGIASTVTLAAPGWTGDHSAGILVKDSAGLIGPWHEPLYVYGDPCRWSTTTPTTAQATVDEVTAALASQASRDASAPVDVTLDGYAGKKITLHVPEDLESTGEGVFPDCDDDQFASWGTESEPGPTRYHQFPGQVDEVWVVDIDGQAAVLDASYATDTPAQTVDEMRAIIESIDFEP